MRKRIVIGMLVAIGAVLLAGCCSQCNTNQAGGTYRGNVVQAHHDIPVIKAAFEGGEALIGVYDDSRGDILMAGLPAAVQCHDKAGQIKSIAFSPDLFEGRQTEGMTPEAGDIAVNLHTGEVLVFCQDSTYSPDLLPLGHVLTDLQPLKAMTGSFDVYLLKSKK